FVDLRDASGVCQVVFRSEDVAERAHRLRKEYCVAATGVVDRRPEGSENANLDSGEIEIDVTSFEVLGEAAALPFQLDDEVGEEARLRHRYLDLRREG
ncbi:OB-fold nucleic acid binding domain-containing protein, partial [Klebsiella pneumoniae]|uniref:OB-fold nucleic acid binding domain-containing protein n=1 Tax=Klebsiella pneumoniae TaxID=573 RepID=UPI0025A1F42B